MTLETSSKLFLSEFLCLALHCQLFWTTVKFVEYSRNIRHPNGLQDCPLSRPRKIISVYYRWLHMHQVPEGRCLYTKRINQTFIGIILVNFTCNDCWIKFVFNHLFTSIREYLIKYLS